MLLYFYHTCSQPYLNTYCNKHPCVLYLQSSKLSPTPKLTRGILWKVNGYIGRYIVYTGDDFKEGLSLTVHDEITRLRKCGLRVESMVN